MPGRPKLSLLTLVLVAFSGSFAHAQVVDYAYEGWSFNTFNNQTYQVLIDMQINEALITPNGHFQRYVDLSTSDSPFVRLNMSDHINEIDDIRLDPETDYRRVKYFEISFDTDNYGDIRTWSISATDGYQSPGHSIYYTITSAYSADGEGYDKVILKTIDPFDNFSIHTVISETPVSGYWYRSVIPVGHTPLPGSLILFLSGLGLGTARHCRNAVCALVNKILVPDFRHKLIEH
jgi:hypothetical protein